MLIRIAILFHQQLPIPLKYAVYSKIQEGKADIVNRKLLHINLYTEVFTVLATIHFST